MNPDWATPESSELGKFVRERVETHLATYSQDRTRIREDARHESAVLEAAYRRRQVIELIQNGADAMRSEPGGRIEVVLTPLNLYVANTGAPLTQAGVEGLLYIGLSEKTGKEIGRLGVGFKSVLEVSDAPMLLSRSGSVRFDRTRSRELIESRVGPVETAPVMRLAEVINPYALASDDAVVAKMMAWASSIVVLPLDRGSAGDDLAWLPATLSADELRAEFLLFSQHVGEVLITDEWSGTTRRIRCSLDGDDYVLSDSGSIRATTRWRVCSCTIPLSEEARRDGGERFGRSDVDLAWAVPSTPELTREVRQLWSFFPVPGVSSSLPGILNTAWKLSEDRGNVVEGQLNDELIHAAAMLVGSTLPDHGSTARPGFVLDLLPPLPQLDPWRRGRDAGWFGPRLQDAVWSVAGALAVVPSEAGTWRVGSELLLWPSWSNKPSLSSLMARWQELIVAPERWVHRSVMTDDRVPRATRLGAITASVGEWLQAVLDDTNPDESSAAAVAFVHDLSRDEATRDSAAEMLGASIVWSQARTWIAIEDVRFDSDATPSVRAAEAVEEVVRHVHELYGISASLAERELVDLFLKGPTGGEWIRFWDLVHQVGADRTHELLASYDMSSLRVKVEGGAFKGVDGVLRPGAILRPGEAPDYAVDMQFHGCDDVLLSQIGVVEVPVALTMLDAFLLHRYTGPAAETWRALQVAQGLSRPRSDYARMRPLAGRERAPGQLALVEQLPDVARQRWTAEVLKADGWAAPWRVSHSTTPERYGVLEIPSPTGWALKEFGVFASSLGRVGAAELAGTELAAWSRVLPVAQGLDPAEQAALELPQTLSDLTEKQASAALDRAVAQADEMLDPAPVVFMARMANEGWPAPQGIDEVEITTCRDDALPARDASRRVWLVEPEHLGQWPVGWSFTIAQPRANAAGDIEIFTLAEYFPTLAVRIENAEAFLVWECDRVTVGSTTVDFGRDGDVLLVTRSTAPGDRRNWLLGQLLPQASETERRSILADERRWAERDLTERVRNASDDVARLIALIGADGARAAAARLLPTANDADATASARTLLTTYGPSTLREVRDLIPSILAPPVQWAGGARAIDFVRGLGFGDAYAGRRKSERSDAERVAGPVIQSPLHPFQEEIAFSVRTLLDSTGRGVIDLPTGAGKTRVAIEAVLQHAKQVGGLGTVVWLAERDELCEQAVTQWMQLWRAKGLVDQELAVLRYWGGRLPAEPNESNRVVVASRQQLDSRLGRSEVEWLRNARLLVIDEAHHSTASTYLKILRWRSDSAPRPAVLGLSATPFRSDAERTDHLARLFDRSLVTGSMMGTEWKQRIRWLQQHQYLSSVDLVDLHRGLVEPTIEEARALRDVSNLTTGIDQMNQRLGEDDERNQQLVDVVAALDPDWPVVVFAGSVEHAKVLASRLVEQGIPSRPIWGELVHWARRDAIETFRSRKLRVLTNYNVLSEGFDAPQTRAVVIARLVRSDGLFLQMLGRGMRGPLNGGTERCQLITTGERLPERFDRDGQLDIERFEYLWSTR